MTITHPLISVVTPVGPRHHDHIKVARASVAWQTVPSAWVEHLVAYDERREGPAVLRNRLIEQARGTFVVCLDADDYLIPTALETYLRGYARANASYVYADNYVINHDGAHYSNSGEYEQAKMARWNIHVVTALVPTALAREVGGFDETIDIWEDWSLWMRLAMRGYCGQRLAQPALVYRLTEGQRMQAGLNGGAPLMEAVWRRYANARGEIVMCGCNRPAAAIEAQHQAQIAVQVLGGIPMAPDGTTRLEYQGPQQGSFFVTAPSGRQYKLGGRRLVDAPQEDVAHLVSLGCAPIVPAEFVPPPDVVLSDAPPQPEPEPIFTPAPELEAAIQELAPDPDASVDGEPFEPKRMRRRAS